MPPVAASDPVAEGLIVRLGEPEARFDGALGTALQEAVNTLTAAEDAREYISRAAARAHARFAQYEGHWSGERWEVGIIGARVETKGGVAFERGDVILWHEPTEAEIRSAEEDGLPPLRTAYSIRNGVDTAFDVDVQPMAER